MPKQSDPFRRLVAIMEILRSPGGCPWDSEQTPQSITPYLIEEAFEVVDAIEQSDTANLKEELGDLLLQVVFQARMAQEVGDFDIDGVAEAISNKLVERHPHVFGDAEADTPDQVLTNWEAIKAEERKAKGVERTSMLDGIPNHLPALLKARRAQEKATRVGFDWDSVDEVVAKVDEEMGELRQAMSDA
ncbi:MAG: nucleoside triphosphate pyrophosphohydrolase, partial [Candidatus Latescibacteria bacterium]|nr:nucleoside triphosphate pyrophosphohydrolase [Candidatus Latescibacterota bacterium]